MLKLPTTAAEPFYPLGKPIQRPAPATPAKGDTQIKPGIWRKADGTLETRGYETPTPKPKPAAPEAPATAPATLGDGWIEWSGGECPIPALDAGEFEVRWSDGSVDSDDPALEWRWRHEPDVINLIAYRLLPTDGAQ